MAKGQRVADGGLTRGRRGNVACSIQLPASRFYLLAIVLLFFLLGCTASTGGSATQTQTAGQQFGFELTRDWRVLSIMVTIVTALLVALAYLFGQSLDIPELKAWASVELVQIIATLVIITTFSIVFTLIDNGVAVAVNSSNLGFTCTALQNCATETASRYLDGLVQLSRKSVGDLVNDGLVASWLGSIRVGGACATAFWWPCLQLYVAAGIPGLGHFVMDFERYSHLMQFQGSILSILESQRFFVNEISFHLAPVILVLGIVGRSFFVTRRLGGLLMAIGLGVMFVFPAMYVVNWLSLNITLFGDTITPPVHAACPAACQIPAPQFYTTGNPMANEEAVKHYLVSQSRMSASAEFTDAESILLRALRNGSRGSASIRGRTVYSCEYAARTPDGYCATTCRQMPLPLGQECTAHNASALMHLCSSAPSLVFCDNTSDSYGMHDPKKACYSMPEECRPIRYVQDPEPSLVARCPENCKTILPLKYDCSDDCLEARDYCRVAERNITGTIIGIQDRINRGEDQGGLGPECQPATACAVPTNLDAASHPAENSCVYIEPTPDSLGACAECVFVPTEYTHEPPVYVDCASLCEETPRGPPTISAAQFAETTRNQMFGDPHTTAVSSLILPAYILPLMNVLVTLMFIRTFAPIFGGDIEIPGVTKLL